MKINGIDVYNMFIYPTLCELKKKVPNPTTPMFMFMYEYILHVLRVFPYVYMFMYEYVLHVLRVFLFK